MFDWFKSSNKESATQQPTWNPNTMTMQQPSAPEAPVTEQVVTGQPVRPIQVHSPWCDTGSTLTYLQGQQETMQMNLRGGGEGEDVCCGVYVYSIL